MPRNTWHIIREDRSVTVARHLPVRFDVSVEADLPAGRALQVAQQVRQDMWRSLQSLRGFSPVVQVTETATGLNVRAGGRFEGRFPKSTAEAQIEAVLHNPRNRVRWANYAARRKEAANV